MQLINPYATNQSWSITETSFITMTHLWINRTSLKTLFLTRALSGTQLCHSEELVLCFDIDVEDKPP